MMKHIKLILILLILLVPSQVHAFWMWTPETNEWVNPKYAVKDTPLEQLNYALGFFNAKEYKEAYQEFKKLIKHYPKARQAPEAQYYIGRVLEAQEKYYEAFKAYQEVIDKYPFSDLSQEIVKKQYEIGVQMLEGQAGKSRIMQGFLTDEYSVVDVFRAVIKNAPYGDLAPVAQYKIGLYLVGKQMYQEARDEFEKVINDYPESEWAKAARYQIAQSDAQRSTDAPYDQKTTQSAIAEFKEFLTMNPDAELSADAKNQINQLREKEAENNFLAAQFYEKQKNFKSAKIYYQSIVDDYPQTSWAKKSLERIREISE